MCIQDSIKDTSDKIYINVLSWKQIAQPKQYPDPIPLYGGMRVPQGYAASNNKPPLTVFAVMVNPEILKMNGKNATNKVDRDIFIDLLFDFVEAMNPGLQLSRNPNLLKDRDLAGELKDVWLVVQNRREREKAQNQRANSDITHKIYHIDGPQEAVEGLNQPTRGSDAQNLSLSGAMQSIDINNQSNSQKNVQSPLNPAEIYTQGLVTSNNSQRGINASCNTQIGVNSSNTDETGVNLSNVNDQSGNGYNNYPIGMNESNNAQRGISSPAPNSQIGTKSSNDTQIGINSSYDNQNRTDTLKTCQNQINVTNNSEVEVNLCKNIQNDNNSGMRVDFDFDIKKIDPENVHHQNATTSNVFNTKSSEGKSISGVCNIKNTSCVNEVKNVTPNCNNSEVKVFDFTSKESEFKNKTTGNGYNERQHTSPSHIPIKTSRTKMKTSPRINEEYDRSQNFFPVFDVAQNESNNDSNVKSIENDHSKTISSFKGKNNSKDANTHILISQQTSGNLSEDNVATSLKNKAPSSVHVAVTK